MSPLSRPAGRWTVLAVICAAVLVVVIDVTVLHVAAPAMTEDLQPSSVALLWIIDVYPLVVAPLLVASGALGDRFGRKRLLLTGLVVFGFASVLAAFAWSPAVLIGARAVMGVGGAMILPATMSIVRNVFEDRDERRTAVGIWSATLAGGAAIGPLVGGFLVEHWWWGAVFLINVPVVLIVLPIALRLLPESRAAKPPPWDTTAVILSGVGILGLAFGIKEGARHGFAEPAALVALSLALVSLTVFVRRQLARPEPLLDVRLFGDRAFAIAVGCVLLAMFGLVGLELFFALYFQLVLGLEPLAASVRLLPLMIAGLAGGLLAAPLLRRLGTRATISGGLLLSTVALLPMLALGVEDEYLLLALPFVALGLGLEIALVAANDVIISAVPADRAGNAASIEETAYELGGGLGVAVLGSILAAVYSSALGPVSGVGAAGMDAAGESLGRAVDVAAGLPATVGNALVAEASDAFVTGLHVVMLASAVLLAVSAVLSAVALRRPPAPPRPKPPARRVPRDETSVGTPARPAAASDGTTMVPTRPDSLCARGLR
ncbi:MAG: MFS transporter [Solirubrobacterales bacterium]